MSVSNSLGTRRHQFRRPVPPDQGPAMPGPAAFQTASGFHRADKPNIIDLSPPTRRPS
ncbi:hypothetical protein [uncultured Aquitalea sp.]|uniref:hypothetical protein n=1 Tax=uncultured Aquitalea sp. TaxID=540272 RepID=UPI0025E74E15|nr:hypothetical protein [uncultured Aquitalea sp.]